MTDLIKHETTIVKIEHWNEEKNNQYHLVNEFLNCPHKFKVEGYGAILFEIGVQGDCNSHPEYYEEARQSFIYTLQVIHDANHMQSSNIYSNYIKHLVESYNAHKNPNYNSENTQQEENLVNFHSFVSQDPTVMRIIQSITEKNHMGAIVFVTPELAPWFKIGGLAVMVDELARGFADLGEDTYVIVPFFDNKKNSGGKIELDPNGEYGIKYLFNISVNLGKTYEVFGIHHGVINGVKIYFIHNSVQFFEPYPGFDNVSRLKSCTLFCKAALQLLCSIEIIPEAVITNDWFTAFTSGYARDEKHFGKIFQSTTFIHIFHNLDITYEGRFYTSPGETLEHIHDLPNDWLIDPFWSDHVINPSRLALCTADQWTSVSKSYRDQIICGSPLSPLLSKFSKPFACSNGVSVKERLKVLAKELKKRDLKHMDHIDAKRFLMEKYLNTNEVDPELCIFSFVGRITEQKGVDVICSVVEEFLNATNFKTAFIIGGPATVGDPHGDKVISACDYLIHKFPKNFYAAPREFFYDVPVLSLGSSYCLMPSRFEPGGIVQHEFFIASTPAVVFATGGLKDSVNEYDYNTGKGNGFEFLNYDRSDLLVCLHRAYNAFKDKEVYRRLRKNAFESAIDVADVSKEWCSEVYRNRGKVFIDKTNFIISSQQEEDKDETPPYEKSEVVGEEENRYVTQVEQNYGEVDFNYFGKSTDKAYVAGAFNGWNERQFRMSYNHQRKEFHCNIMLAPGKHQYKIKINGKWKLDHQSVIEKDTEGQEVNVIVVESS